jgi:esterase
MVNLGRNQKQKETQAMFRIFPLALAFLLTGCQAVLKPAWELPPGVKTLPANGYPMAFLERGVGPTVVLVHGALQDYRYWDAQVSSLSPQFRVIAVSLRHYYPERWNGKGADFSAQQQAKDLVEFIENLGIGPVYLVGHSRGGRVTLDAARARPDLIRKLVLMEAIFYSLLPVPSGTTTADSRTTGRRRPATFFEQGDIEGGLEFYVDDANGPGTWKRRTDEQRQVSRDNAWTVVADEGEWSVTCDEVGSLRMPVLLMGGEKSPRRLVNVVDATHKCLPSAKRATIPNAAHPMNRQNPAAFDAALVKFLLD